MHRLLAPRSIAMIGGAWADAAVAASRAIGYEGKLWRIHPRRPSSPETPYFRSVDELPGVSRSEVNIGTARVEYDESKVKGTDLEQAVEKAGYKVVKG